MLIIMNSRKIHSEMMKNDTQGLTGKRSLDVIQVIDIC